MVFGLGRSSTSKRSSKGAGSSLSSTSRSSLSSASRSSASSRSSSRTGWEYLNDRSSRSSQSSYYSGASSSTIRGPGSSHTLRPRDLTASNMMAYDRASGNRLDDLESVGAGSSISQDRYGNPRRPKSSSRSRSYQPESDVISRSSTSSSTPSIVTIRPKGVRADSDLGSGTSNDYSSVRSRSQAPSIRYAVPKSLGMPPARPPTSYPYSDQQSVSSSQAYSDTYSDTPMGMAMVPQPPSSYTPSNMGSLGGAAGSAGDLRLQSSTNLAYGPPIQGSGPLPVAGSNITVVVNTMPGPYCNPCPPQCPPPCYGSSCSASCCSFGPCH